MPLQALGRIREGFAGQRMVVLPPPVVRTAQARPVTAELLVTDIGHFPSASRHYVERAHGVRQLILIYCAGGRGWARLGRGTHSVGAGQLLAVTPGCPHGYGATHEHPWTIYWCHVVGRNVPALTDMLGVGTQRPVLEGADPAVLVPLFERVLQALLGGYTRPSLVTASLTLGHLFGVLLSARRRAADGASRDDAPAGADARIERTVEFMRRSVRESVRVAELAAMAKLSPSHYAAAFKRKTGFAVLDYFIRLRVQEACRLLDATDAPVKDVAARVGYDDPLYFSRAFKRVMALPPTEYRRIRKG